MDDIVDELGLNTSRYMEEILETLEVLLENNTEENVIIIETFFKNSIDSLLVVVNTWSEYYNRDENDNGYEYLLIIRELSKNMIYVIDKYDEVMTDWRIKGWKK